MGFTKELIDKAKECKSAEEILALAKANEIKLTKEDAEALLGEFREGELSDEELDNVAGGADGCKPANTYEKIFYKTQGSDPSEPISVREFLGYVDEYWLEKCSGVSSAFVKGWYTRDRIEK